MKRTIIVIVILFLLLIVLFIFKSSLNQSPAPIAPTPSPSSSPLAINGLLNPQPAINYRFPSTSPPQLPSSLPSYQAVIPPINPQQLGPHNTTNQLSDQSRSTTVIRWQANGFEYLIRPAPLPYLFISAYKTSPPPPAISPNQASTLTLQLLREINLLDSTLTLMLSGSQYLIANNYNQLPTTNPSAGNLTQITYAYNLNNIPLFMSSTPLFSIQATFYADSTLNKLSVFPPPQLTNLGNKNLIPLQEATSKLRYNRGVLVNAEPNLATETTIEPNFNQATIKQVRVIYIFDKSSDQVRPAYQFTGTAPHLTRRNIIFDIIYLVPAN